MLSESPIRDDLREGPVFVMDSGVGGTSVLAALVAELSHERFLYFGDSAYAPYGEKPLEWVIERSRELVAARIDAGAKAVVIACNTATSASAEILRAEHPEVPIVGIEPALKPAARALPGGLILVMATPMTLKLDKYQHLADEWGAGCTVVPVSCDGLAAAIEQEGPESDAVAQLVGKFVGPYRGKVDGVVLGCTHYPLAAGAVRSVLGDVPLFDGSIGTARQLRRVLAEAGLLSRRRGSGEVVFTTSSRDTSVLDSYRRLFEFGCSTIPAQV